MDHPIDETVLEQELRTLEPDRQLLGDRARRDPRSSEADEGVRLRQVDVAENGERGEDAARRRVRQDGDEWDAGGPQPLERRPS